MRNVVFELRPHEGIGGGLCLQTADGVEIPPTRFREKGNPIFCHSCRALKTPSVRMTVVLEKPPSQDVHLTFVWNFCAILSAPLLDALGGGSNLRASTYLAPIRSPSAECATHFAYWPIAPVLVRGDQSSFSKRCPECGKLHYRAEGDKYILRRESEFVVTAAQKGFLVEERLLETLSSVMRKSIRITAITVRDVPNDDLPDDLRYMEPSGR